MIVAVTGGRRYRPNQADAWALRAALRFHAAAELRHGGCAGVDEYCGRVAERLSIPVVVFPATVGDADKLAERWPDAKLDPPPEDAEWPSAGPRRNRRMLEGVGILIAMPGGQGTRDCIAAAEKMGIPITRVGPWSEPGLSFWSRP